MEFGDDQNNLQIGIDKLKHWNVEIKLIHFKVMSRLQKLSDFIFKEVFLKGLLLYREALHSWILPLQSSQETEKSIICTVLVWGKQARREDKHIQESVGNQMERENK